MSRMRVLIRLYLLCISMTVNLGTSAPIANETSRTDTRTHEQRSFLEVAGTALVSVCQFILAGMDFVQAARRAWESVKQFGMWLSRSEFVSWVRERLRI
jgi:hypothetical protein